MKCLLILCSVTILSAQLFEFDTEEINSDWNDSSWNREGRVWAFPEDQKEQCLGEKMILNAGETAVIKSHKGFGKYAYSNGYRCRWIFKPFQCDLGLTCYLKTRSGSRSGFRGGCSGGDYLRIMKGKDMGDSTKVDFHKKYCGKRTASLKFSGEDTVKMVFKSSQESRQQLSNLDGWTCKVTCKSPSLNFSKPKPTTKSFLDMLATAKPVTKPSTTTKRTTTTTASTTTTSTTPAPAPSSKCQCGVATHAAKSRWNQLKIQGKIICPPGEICDSDPVPWQVGESGRTTEEIEELADKRHVL